MLHVNVDSIEGWSDLCTVKDVQTFIGFANFYRCFIQNFRGITRSITDMLKVDLKNFQITNEYQEAFRQLKKTFIWALIMRYFNPDLPSIVETDASDLALGAILLQCHEGRLHSVAFIFHKFHPAEVNYEVYNRKMLAIVDFLKQWRHYLENVKHLFIIYTDHKNLEYFLMTKYLNHNQAR